MRTRLTRSIVASTAAVMALTFLQTTASAQRGFLEGEPKPPAPIPSGRHSSHAGRQAELFRSLELARISGAWAGALPLQPWAQKLADERRKTGGIG